MSAPSDGTTVSTGRLSLCHRTISPLLVMTIILRGVALDGESQWLGAKYMEARSFCVRTMLENLRAIGLHTFI